MPNQLSTRCQMAVKLLSDGSRTFTDSANSRRGRPPIWLSMVSFQSIATEADMRGRASSERGYERIRTDLGPVRWRWPTPVPRPEPKPYAQWTLPSFIIPSHNTGSGS